MRKLSLDDDGCCFVCGEKNPGGLKLVFRHVGGRTGAEFLPQKIHQGFQGIVHGGIITAVLDEAMVKAVLSQGIKAVTAEITVRFKSVLPVGERSFVEAEITKMGDRLIATSARLTKNDHAVVAEAQAKLLRNA